MNAKDPVAGDGSGSGIDIATDSETEFKEDTGMSVGGKDPRRVGYPPKIVQFDGTN